MRKQWTRHSRHLPTAAVPLAITALTALYASPTWACAVCFDAKGENRWAFLGTTALLTFLPLGVIGGTIWWLRKQVTAHASDGSADDPAQGSNAEAAAPDVV